MRGGVSCEMSTTCMQGGIRPLGGYQPNMMIEPSSPDSPWPYPSVIPKAEPRDHEERTDSGINSGSDFTSSSPGSDHSEAAHYTSHHMPVSNTPVPHNFYSTPRARPPVIYSPEQNQRLSPPAGELKPEPMRQSPLPSCSSSPEEMRENDAEDCLRKLQMSLEKNGFLAPPASVSPKPSEYSIEDDNKSDNDMEEFDEQGLRIPRVNSHGKVKTYKCKQCDFVAITKLDFWDHTKGHIKEEKRLYCTKCPFVTEYKHHLEYHLRNHVGSKPFKCSQCNYSCVNKSMLNSHLKSHSNIYQYRCSECSYAAKYCHSLKLHLRKYGHKPAMVLNPDGTPNPLPIIDVYGTRRGPKMKIQDQRPPTEESPINPEQLVPFALNQFLAPQMQLPFAAFPFPFAGFPGALPNPLLLQNLEKIARQSQNVLPKQEPAENTDGVLDLSKPEESQRSNHQSRTYKLSSNDSSQSENDEDDDDASTTMFSNVEVVENKDSEESSAEKEETNNNDKEDYCCHYCKISFGDPVLYTMHMGYHGYRNPFTCNMCGEECKDKVSFFLHIARTPHS